MSEFSNQLKEKADIGRLIGEYVALKPAGNGFAGLCPFHGEKSPSFHVHAAKRFYYCFGCHAHGDVFQFYMQFKKLSFPEAVAAVAERMGIPVPDYGGAESDANPRRNELLRMHAVAAELFQNSLRSPVGASARAYLQGRDLPPAAWDRFQLGYAPEGGRVLALHLQQQGFPPDLALQAGLCQPRRESLTASAGGGSPAAWPDLYDRFRHRLLFPIADERGRVIAFGARLLESATVDRKAPKYLNSPESPLYTKGRVLYNLDRAREAIRHLNYVILVEGYFDCIRVFMAGFENVLASCGTALTSAQIKPLTRWTQKAIINFDPDTAGASAAERSIGMLLEEGFQMRVVVLPAGLDPDQFIRREGADGNSAYAEALKTSRSFFDYLATRARSQFDLRRAEGKVAAINHLLPFLGRVQEPIQRQQLAENLAGQLGLDHQSIISRQLLGAARDRRAALAPAALPQAELLPAERIVLRAWIEWEPRRAALAAALLDDGLLVGLASFPLAQTLFPLSTDPIDTAALADRLEVEDRQLLASLLMGGGDDERLTEPMVAAAMEALHERRRLATTRDLQEQIQAAATMGDKQRLGELLRQKQAEDRKFREKSHASGASA